MRSNKVLYSVQHEEGREGGIISAAFSASGDVLVTVEQNSIARWSAKSGRLTGYWLWPNLTHVAVSADGRYTLIGSKDNQAVYFDMVEGKMRYVFPHHQKVNRVALSDDGEFALASAFIGDANIYATRGKGSLVSRLDEIRMTLVSADFSADSRILATGRTAKAIDIWEVASGKLRESWQPKVKYKVQPDSATILDLKLDTNAKTLISESSSGIGQRWALN